MGNTPKSSKTDDKSSPNSGLSFRRVKLSVANLISGRAAAGNDDSESGPARDVEQQIGFGVRTH
jgi:hypothetical protein